MERLGRARRAGRLVLFTAAGLGNVAAVPVVRAVRMLREGGGLAERGERVVHRVIGYRLPPPSLERYAQSAIERRTAAGE